jgi:hypothetical protein
MVVGMLGFCDVILPFVRSAVKSRGGTQQRHNRLPKALRKEVAFCRCRHAVVHRCTANVFVDNWRYKPPPQSALFLKASSQAREQGRMACRAERTFRSLKSISWPLELSDAGSPPTKRCVNPPAKGNGRLTCRVRHHWPCASAFNLAEEVHSPLRKTCQSGKFSRLFTNLACDDDAGTPSNGVLSKSLP